MCVKYLIPLLCGLLCFSSCKQSSDTASKQNDKQSQSKTAAENKEQVKKIVFFGDSLTAAYNIDMEDGYVALLQKKVNEKGLPYKLINAGNSGETSAGGLNRIDWILKQDLDIFVLELGANDGLRGIDTHETKKNLQTIVDKVKAKNPNVKLAIAAMEAPPNMGQVFTKSFRAIFTELAKDNEMTYIPFMLNNVAGIKELNLPDGIHPNEKGQKIVAENIWNSLKDLL